MLQSSTRTTALPLPLLVLTVLLLLVRIGLTVNEKLHPRVTRDLIHWKTMDQVPVKPELTDKNYLFLFTADWCEPCRVLERTALQNSEVVRLINENFIPVKIIDRKKEDGKNPDRIRRLESKYRVNALPTMVMSISSPELDFVDSRTGAVPGQEMIEFFHSGSITATYRRGLAAMSEGNYSVALNSFDQWSKSASPSNKRFVYAALFKSVALIDEGKKDEAEDCLKEVGTRATSKRWPYALLKYLDRPREKLIAAADPDEEGEQAEARYFSAVTSHLRGDDKQAIEDLQWIRKNCPTDQFYCAILAERLQEKLAKSGVGLE